LNAAYALYISYVKAAPTPSKAESHSSKNGGNPALYEDEPAVKAYIGLKTVLYTVFRLLMFDQNRINKIDMKNYICLSRAAKCFRAVASSKLMFPFPKR